MLLRYLILLIFFCAISYVQSDGESPCRYKLQVNSELVKDYCQVINGTLTHGCCYIPSNGTFAAVDLSAVNLTSVPRLNFGNFEYSVIVIDLRLNPYLQLQKNAFMNLTNLYDLYLPNNMTCPGGHDAWETIEEVDDGVHCQHQKDLCLTIENPCPKNVAICSSNGPNLVSCLCKPGHTGYKCLRAGNFPYAAFIVPTAVVTILASALLFWTHRRHVKDR